tara:strand:+ start:1111 stop:1338 length:228 start_codon:yes stop_codon:yes gene_type:complete
MLEKLLEKIKLYLSQFCKRKRQHKEQLFSNIMQLRNEIIDMVLMATANKKHLPIRKIKFKAQLIKKYSRKLREFI